MPLSCASLKNQKLEKYPYIKYPELVEEYLSNETPCLDEISLPQKVELQKKDYTGYYISIGLVILLIILLSTGVTNIIFYTIIILMLWFSFFGSKPYNQRVEQENKGRLSEFDKRVNEVNKLNQERKSAKLRLNNEEKIKEYCQGKINEILKNYSHPQFVEWEEKKGISEKFFLRILFDVFGDIVKPFSKLYGDELSRDYMPDYVIMDENLCLNIEIDEPYTLKDKLPIHCKDDEKNERRDNFFTSNKWCVIRFAERQIFFEPYECCKLIADTYLELTGTEIKGYHKLKLRKHPNQIERWDSKSANEMAVNATRENEYLKANHYASQIEYFPRNYFEDDKNILITNIGKWDEVYYSCMTSNIKGIKKIKLSNKLFPEFNYGQTIVFNTDEYQLEYDSIIHSYQTNEDIFNPKYEEFEERIIAINRKRTHNKA